MSGRVRRQDEESDATGHQQYRQSVGPHWSDSEEEENPIQLSDIGCSSGVHEYREPLSPPPP